MEQRTNYSLLVAELQKRFTPVHLPTEQSSLFHDKKQGLTETVDQYAQQLRFLFNKAYPSIQQGTKEAETSGQTVLVNQFVAELLPAIKSKLREILVICLLKLDLRKQSYSIWILSNQRFQ